MRSSRKYAKGLQKSDFVSKHVYGAETQQTQPTPAMTIIDKENSNLSL